MAKKGGAQQLQAEINTDEDLHKFLEKPGLLVLDVYSEWCGPCVAMVGSLRKIKLELGGDNLHLAVCKSDTIEAFARFRNKSEPTWLFATQGKLVNLMFGSDVPKLMQIITNELSELGSTKSIFYEITEMQPEECARRDVIEKAKAEAHQKEMKEAQRQRREYLTHVTNEILANLPDIGVTIFGPHIQRDTYKKLMETAENQKISCKDRRTAPLFPEHFEVINFSCENPIDPEIRDHMCNKDLLVGFWKISEQDTRPLEEIFLAYAKDLTQPREITTDDGEIETFPPILAPLEVKVTKKIQIEVKKEQPPPEPEDEQFDDPLDEILPQGPLPGEENEEDKDGEESNKKEEKKERVKEPVKEPKKIPEPVCPETLTHTIQVPPIWVPTDRRTHATLIYVFFRAQTSTFLPPDPIPEPPHVVMAYDAYKKKEIFDEITKHQEDVLQFGFFTDDNPETAQLIANTLVKYELRPPQTTDKLVLKVAKQNSSTMLAFANFGPSYISANTVVGKEEALKFFPEGYTTREEEIEETETEIKKKKKGKKTAGASDQTPTEEEGSTPEETPDPA